MRIKLSSSRKRYLKGKNIYDYTRAYLLVPQKFFKRLEPYFKEDFQADLAEDETKIALTYIYLKKLKK